VDMHTDGVVVRPLRQMTGDAHFNEVFFEDAWVPAENVVGTQGKGWKAAITTLMNERVAIGAMRAGGGGNSVRSLIDLARIQGLSGDHVVRQRLAEAWIGERILGFLGERIRQAQRAGRPPGPEGSVAKMARTRQLKLAAVLGVEIAGPASVAWPDDDPLGPRVSRRLLESPSASIAGGTDEILKNIIGERVLGLPKEPQVDRDVPFREFLVGVQRSG
jgi:alkylation response protein AidB-like acyl-CoA dehydrogenase